MVAPILIFAIGNESRGDDALGPLLLQELDAWLKLNSQVAAESPPPSGGRVREGVEMPYFRSATPHPSLPPGRAKEYSEQFELLEDFQLQIEHAMDMKGRRVVLFVDAGMDTHAPFSFYRAHADVDPVLYSHSLSPEALLKVYTQFYNEAPPDVFILCIRGEQFELGEDISKQAKDNLAGALELGKILLSMPECEAWDRQCVQKTLEHSTYREDNRPA